MPDPDPQPPKPRPIFPTRWMLLLWPSLLMLGTPMILERMELRWQYVDLIMTRILAFAVMLCFVLGFRLEKWLRGEIKSIVWALNYGFMILLGNGVVLFAVFTAFFFPKLR